jgi:hypothetical protein
MPARKIKRTTTKWWQAYRVELFFLLLAVLPAIYIALSNANTILDWYSSDDGFYYFQVARNLAIGQGFTFDGLNPTNGFHPLWLFLITPLFAFAQADPLLPLRLLVVLSALLSAGTAILLYRLVREIGSAAGGVLAGLLWIVVPSIHTISMHAGVEGGLNAFCLVLFWYALVSFPTKASNPFRALAAVGALAALAVLARLDNVFVVGAGMLWLWWRLWSPPQVGKRAIRSPWGWRLQTGVALVTPVAVTLAVYIFWNLIAFNTATPVSGQVKLWWGTLRNTVYGFPVNSAADFFGQFFTDDTELGPWSLLTAPLYAGAEWLLRTTGQAVTVTTRRMALLGLGGLLTIAIGALAWVQRTFLRAAATTLGLLPFLVGCILHIAYYKLSGYVAQQPWYWMAQMLMLLMAAGLLFGALLRQLDRRISISRNAALALGVAALTLLAIAHLSYLQTGVRAPGDGSNHFYIHRARWLEANTEPGERIAITGAGNLAYFAQDRTIVNMDGLMNTVAYLHALEQGQGAVYLASLGVDYVFGNEYILTETNPYAPMLAGHLEPYTAYLFGADRELPLWRFVP